MDRDTSTDIARWFRSVGADGDGVLPDDGGGR